MKIALVHYSFPPAPGGVEWVVQQQARLLADAGHEVTVVAGSGENADAAFALRLVPELAVTGNPVAVGEAIRTAIGHAEMVIVHNILTMPFHPTAAAALWEIARTGPARMISWIHDLGLRPEAYPRSEFRDGPVEFVAVSTERARTFETLTGREPGSCRVIPNSLDPFHFLGASARLTQLFRDTDALAAEVILLQPSRLLARKNVELTIELIAASRALGADVRAFVTAPADRFHASSAAYVAQLRALRAQLGVEREVVFITEHFPPDLAELRALYGLADALFLPSREEGFGLPLLEAGLLRLPIFAADLASLRGVAGEEACYFSPEVAPRALAERILDHLRALPAAGARRRILREFSPPIIYKHLLEPLLRSPYCMSSSPQSTVHPDAVRSLLEARHGDPFSLLGLHPAGDGLVVRVFRPEAASVTVRDLSPAQRAWSAVRTNPAGFFEALIPGTQERFPYELAFTSHTGTTWSERDVYSFPPILGPLDLHLFAEGNHFELHEKLGAHLTELDGVPGVTFAVWAPNAQRVSVVGDFNGWDGRLHPMRKLLGSGVWEIFLPGLVEGTHYKFELLNAQSAIVLKSDPFAFYSQHGLKTASMVFDINRYHWADDEWMTQRSQRAWHRSAVCAYEVHLGSWARNVEEGRPLSYRELADQLVDYVVDLGYTHIELMPVAEHPFEGSWGYQIIGYFAPTSRFGNPDEFRWFVDRCHQRGIGVILDWVPGHFPKDATGLAEFDGTDLYEHADPRQGEHTDWGTLIFNYGRNEVRNFLITNALFWLEQYHIDGLRVDAVASMLYLDYSRQEGQWVPNLHGGRENLEAIHFLKRFNEVCYERCPGTMTIAEESTAWPGVSKPTYLGGLGFGFKWNMGWMHDFLGYMAKEPIWRRFHQGDITFSLIYAFDEHFVLVLSHDEVVHGKRSLLSKMPGDVWQQFANLRLFYAWMYAHPGKKLLFMGGEFGQWNEWNHDLSLDWHLLGEPLHAGLRRLVQHLNHVYRTEAALWDQDHTYAGFQWLDFSDADNSVISFLRRSKSGEEIIFVVNATPVIRDWYRVGAPGPGYYREIINTDSDLYRGGNVGNFGGVEAEPIAWQGCSHSLLLRLPPLAVLGLKRG